MDTAVLQASTQVYACMKIPPARPQPSNSTPPHTSALALDVIGAVLFSAVLRTSLSIVQSAKDIDGNEVSFNQFTGKVVLITNVASACGYTEQNYVGLEALYQKYGKFGLEIVAFPSNQFGGQEPGSEANIKAFAQQRYGVTFRLMSKVDVNGPNEHPVFTYASDSCMACAPIALIASRPSCSM